jgi:hypothetical protein
MTRLTVVAVAIAVTVVTAAPAQATEVGSGRNFGLGFQIGEPFALIGKLFLGGENALDFGLGFSGFGYRRCRDANGNRRFCDFGDRDVSIFGDFLWQQPLARPSGVNIDWHFGFGARLLFENTSTGTFVDLIGRVPVGLDFTFPRPPFLELFAEIVPGLLIVPPLYLNIDVGVGARFYF